MKQLLAVTPVKDIPKLPHHWEGILLKVRFHTGRWDMFLLYRKRSLGCIFIVQNIVFVCLFDGV
jgi:hypothetical protein